MIPQVEGKISFIMTTADWEKVTDAMQNSLNRCGAYPPPRFMRVAFDLACSSLGITIVDNPTNGKSSTAFDDQLKPDPLQEN
jgi:hypothetical protein